MNHVSVELESYKNRFLDINVKLCLCVLTAFFLYFSLVHYSTPHLIIISLLSAFYSFYFVLRKLEYSLILRTNFCCFIILICIVSVSFVAGGLQAPANFWLPLIPFTAIALADKNSAIFWVCCSFVWLSFATYLHATGFEFMNNIESADRSMLHSAHSALMIFYMASITRIWDRMTNHLIASQIQVIQSQEETKRIKQVTALSAGFAHEINNPLAIVSLINEKIGRKIQQKNIVDIPEDLENQQRVIERIYNVVRSLSFLSRKPEKIKDSSVALRPIIESIFTELHSKVNFEVETVIDIPAEDRIFAGSEPLRILFYNILQNAFDALEKSDRKKITFSYTTHGSTGAIYVEDTGPGLEDCTTIFDLYFTNKPYGRGSGIGLALVKSICDIYGWQVKASNQGSGARFDLTIGNSASQPTFAP